MPGDTLVIHCEMISMKKKLGKAACKCLVNGETVSEGELLFGLVDK
jgi:UDP-3-O-[3-hydroxymyristoyl] N-acetylglucosamine deacetylase/3-hydroxyacyl-[acyl-carrier-protein] dehydratase